MLTLAWHKEYFLLLPGGYMFLLIRSFTDEAHILIDGKTYLVFDIYFKPLLTREALRGFLLCFLILKISLLQDKLITVSILTSVND